MVKPHRLLVNAVVILLCIQTKLAKKSPKHQCPIGFKIAYSKEKEDPICYRLKGPESFSDSSEDCAGNLYSSKLYYSYNITSSGRVLWTEYRSLYPGGPFADWSYSDPTGDLLSTSFEVNYERYSGIDEYLCIVIDPVSNFTAVSCDEKHYRYCIVKPYSETRNTEGCERFKDSLRFSSPTPTCLVAVSAVGGGAVRATWRQAEELCEKRGGSLLNRGWRYSNNPYFEASGSYPMYPLSIVFNPNRTVMSLDGGRRATMVEESDWNFAETDFASDEILGAVRDNFWVLVNSSYIFYDVLCEKSMELKSVTLRVSVDDENKIILTVNQPVDESELFCFTESVYYPKTVKITYDEISEVYVLKPRDDGYYWCTHIDKNNFAVAGSNMQLFVREKQSLVNVYAVKIRLKDKYKLDSMEKFHKLWEKKLSEYIFYLSRYTKEYGDVFTDKSFLNSTNIEDEIKSYKASLSVDWKDKDIIRNKKVKRMYLDARTALVHIEINPDMVPVPPGKWDGLQVLFMRPVYYCPEMEIIAAMPLGSSVITTSCQNYSCIGDFNEGVQWITSDAEGCLPTHPEPVTGLIGVQSEVTMIIPTVGPLGIATGEKERRDGEDSSEESKEFRPLNNSSNTEPPFNNSTFGNETTDYPTTPTLFEIPDNLLNSTGTEDGESTKCPRPPHRPSTTTEGPTTTTDVPTDPPPRPRPPPEEQLQQVMNDLESLLNNDTETVSVETISGAFDQVDELLAETENLEIPGQLLHLLDGIGARMDLEGSEDVAAVRENIALLVADAQPEMPVKGLRIATRDTDVFTENAFEIMREPVNSTHLQSGESEVVVQLPTSVAASQRRISFVVFRNDRAFQNSIGHYSVNSRVLSINVENITEFDHGEVIDIHLTPMRGDIARNQSRACAYWHFLEDGTGYWSQEGCTFIPSTEDGMLDTCRCDHLTHFAEILIPRTSFSAGHETALEIISIIGCVLSIIGLLMVGLTAILFRTWRRDFSNKIWLQLCLAILLLVTCFLVVVFAHFEDYSITCMLVGVLLHYSTLASFCWMLVAAILSYRRLVMVFTRDTSHKLLKASAFSWGAPCAIVGVLLSVAPRSYAGQFEGDVPSGSFCYPSGLALWLAVYAPIALMLVANWTLFALIVRSVFASRRIQRHGDTNEALRCASVSCLLVFLFGLPWIFGLFLGNLVTVYLFTLTATFQGFVLFVFFVLGNKKTRDLWLNKLKIKQTRKVPVTSSTYTNRSTGNPGWRGGAAGPTSMEAKSAKPRSLASSDDSRFS